VVEKGVARHLEQPGAGLHRAERLALPAGLQEEVVEQIVRLVRVGQPWRR
jgi:hypothetical protein